MMEEGLMTFYEPADITIYIKDKGVVLKEKSLVALNIGDGKVLSVGNDTEHIFDSPEEQIKVISPLHKGIIADYQAAVYLLSSLLKKVLGKKLFPKPLIAVCTPTGLTEVEKKAFTDLFYQVGAREVFLAECPLELLLQKIKTQELTAKWQKIKIFVSITKDEPIHYLKEQLSEALAYAKQEGIADSQVKEMLEDIINK
jgi:hypothetical protein